ncbi:hypothetical protein HAX54_010131 [Datura stramonium]|uniref:Uncharacterized protein n=1 Tax=Datura stramonium TaxID=4076 RepID=A0ABS8TIF6_DATST|nr:hypothetical protein [Datura stramonium]
MANGSQSLHNGGSEAVDEGSLHAEKQTYAITLLTSIEGSGEESSIITTNRVDWEKGIGGDRMANERGNDMIVKIQDPTTECWEIEDIEPLLVQPQLSIQDKERETAIFRPSESPLYQPAMSKNRPSSALVEPILHYAGIESPLSLEVSHKRI